MTTPTNPIPSARMRAQAAKALEIASSLPFLRSIIIKDEWISGVCYHIVLAHEARIAAGKVLPV